MGVCSVSADVPSHRQPAPGDLEVIRDFVNTLDVEDGSDDVATPAALVAWLAARGRMLAIVAHAQSEGTWDRLKSCPADNCRWAFYDRSRNRSAVWCNMAVCGNRAKVRSYRERHTHSRA